MNGEKGMGEDFSGFEIRTKGRVEDDRYIPRWKVKNRVKYIVENGMVIDECETRDLSCSGVCLKNVKMLVPGQKLKMKIYLDELNAVEVTGSVIWNQVDEEGRYAGINFDTATAQVQQEILNYAFDVNREEVLKHWFSDWNKKS